MIGAEGEAGRSPRGADRTQRGRANGPAGDGPHGRRGQRTVRGPQHGRGDISARDVPAAVTGRYAGRRALVNGASSGIGEAFARRLAAEGAAVLLAALPVERERMDVIAGELAAAHGVRTEVATCDLSTPDGPRRLVADADALGFEPDVLVNCAGFWVLGPFLEAGLERQLAMIHLNVVALVALTGTYLPA